MQRVTYPAFAVQDGKSDGFEYKYLRRSRSVFFATRLPKRKLATKGRLFSSAGVVYEYDGMRGWPLFPSNNLTLFLENLVLPWLIWEIYSRVVTYKLNITSERHVAPEEFRAELFSDLSVYWDQRDLVALRDKIKDETDFREIIRAVEWQIAYRSHQDYLEEEGIDEE